jgi:hypothetical protein
MAKPDGAADKVVVHSEVPLEFVDRGVSIFVSGARNISMFLKTTGGKSQADQTGVLSTSAEYPQFVIFHQ